MHGKRTFDQGVQASQMEADLDMPEIFSVDMDGILDEQNMTNIGDFSPILRERLSQEKL